MKTSTFVYQINIILCIATQCYRYRAASRKSVWNLVVLLYHLSFAISEIAFHFVLMLFSISQPYVTFLSSHFKNRNYIDLNIITSTNTSNCKSFVHLLQVGWEIMRTGVCVCIVQCCCFKRVEKCIVYSGGDLLKHKTQLKYSRQIMSFVCGAHASSSLNVMSLLMITVKTS